MWAQLSHSLAHTCVCYASDGNGAREAHHIHTKTIFIKRRQCVYKQFTHNKLRNTFCTLFTRRLCSSSSISFFFVCPCRFLMCVCMLFCCCIYLYTLLISIHQNIACFICSFAWSTVKIVGQRSFERCVCMCDYYCIYYLIRNMRTFNSNL